MVQRSNGWVQSGPFSISWPAVIGGIVVAAGFWVLLHLTGLALGFSQLEPSDSSTLRAIGIGAGIWTVVTSIIAAFCGGLVTARCAGALGRPDAALHGVVLWGSTTLAAIILIFTIVTRVGANAAQLSLPTGMMSSVAESAGLSANDALAPLNEKLQKAGKPTITAAQLQTAVQDAVVTSVRSGTINWEVFQQSLAQNTNLTVQDVRQVVAGSQQRLTAAAEEAAQVTARMFWGLFLVVLASLLASVGGAVLGVSRRQRELSSTASHPAPAAHHHPQTI